MDSLAYRSLRAVVRALVWPLFHLRVVGADRLPQAGAAVLVSNHESWLDPIILPLALPRKPGFLAMEELWRMPVIGLVMRSFGPLAIPLTRGAVDAGALKRSLRALQDGALLIIFPEGGISPSGHLRPFHHGAAMLAAHAKVPIIPIAIHGTAQALPLGRMLPRPRPVTVRVGTPIPPPGKEREALRRATDAAAAQIEDLRSRTPS